MAARLNLPASGWQQERRNALVLLRRAADKAARDKQWPQYDALLFALMDVDDTLRQRAAAAIEEGVGMHLAHIHLHDARSLEAA